VRSTQADHRRAGSCSRDADLTPLGEEPVLGQDARNRRRPDPLMSTRRPRQGCSPTQHPIYEAGGATPNQRDRPPRARLWSLSASGWPRCVDAEVGHSYTSRGGRCPSTPTASASDIAMRQTGFDQRQPVGGIDHGHHRGRIMTLQGSMQPKQTESIMTYPACPTPGARRPRTHPRWLPAVCSRRAKLGAQYSSALKPAPVGEAIDRLNTSTPRSPDEASRYALPVVRRR